MRLRKSSGKVLDIRMEEGSGTVAGDSSRYGNDGALTGCKWIERGLEFNGTSDYVDCGNDPSLNMGVSDFTLIAWVKTISSSKQVILGRGAPHDQGSNNYQGYQIYLNHQAKALKFSVMYDTTNFYSATVTSYPTLFDGNWHLVIGKVIYNQGAYLYVDGNQVAASIKSVSGSIAPVYPLIIGRYSFSPDMFFNGSIDQVRIYNRALTAREIKKHYDSTKHKYI